MPAPSRFRLREFAPNDYDPVVALWRATEGVEVAEGDDRADVVAYLARNPGCSWVAEDESGIVGAMLCGHDGRRGLIYHLAVAPSHRGGGIGRALVNAGAAALARAGIKRALILVDRTNHSGQSYWIKAGFEPIADALPFGRDLP